MAYKFKLTNASETLYSTIFDDVIEALGGNDTIYAMGGNDTVYGGDGRDRIYGGSGADRLMGGNDNDTLHGDSGNDVLYGDAGNDVLYGGTGNDFMQGGSGNDLLYGDSGIDRLLGGDGHDSLYAGSGYDYLYGESGDDLLSMKSSSAFTYYGVDAEGGYYNGGSGIDTLQLETIFAPLKDGSFTGWYVNLASGHAVAHDYAMLSNQPGYSSVLNIENVIGTNQDDKVIGDGLDNEIDGRGGNDYLSGGSGADTIIGGSGNDLIYGNEGSDLMLGGSGNDRIYGSTGNDIISGGTGRDVMSGGSGVDTVDYSYSTSSWYIDLASSFAANSTESSETISSFENVLGGRDDDHIFGTSGNNVIEGYFGDDELTGRSGNDKFVFDDNWGNDTITDFGNGADMLDFSAVAGVRNVNDLEIHNVYAQGVGGARYVTGTEVSYGDDSVFLAGVSQNELSSSDFIF